MRVGSKQLMVDPAVVMKSVPTKEHDVGIEMHVDELLVSASTSNVSDLSAEQLPKSTNVATINRFDQSSYIGINSVNKRKLWQRDR